MPDRSDVVNPVPEPSAPDLQALVDALIPPPSRGRGRAALVALAIVVVVVTGVLWYGDWLRPSITVNGGGWGSTLGNTSGHAVFLEVPVTNDGTRSFDITGADPHAAGLVLRSVHVAPGKWMTDDNLPNGVAPVALPVRVPPGGSATVRFDFDVTDCAAIDFGTAGMPLYVDTRLADPPLPWWHQQLNVVGSMHFVVDPADLPTNVTVGGNEVGWPTAIAVYACRGKW